MRGSGRTLQGYNAQAAATLGQVVVAAELTQQANDVQQLAPMLAAIATTLSAAGIGDRVHRRPGPAVGGRLRLLVDRQRVGDPGCAAVADPPGPPRPARQPGKDGKPSESRSDSLRAAMLARLASDPGKASYAQRSRTIEPVFGQVKTVQGGWRFLRRGLRLVRPSGSCCAAPTTCSSSGGRPWPPPADRHQPPGATPPP